MKLRNKKTGEIRNVNHAHILVHFNDGETISVNTLAKLTDEWEDYEEPKEYWYINEYGSPTKAEAYGRETLYDKARKNFGNSFATKEEAEKAAEKLMAWKRLKDKGFEITSWDNSIGDDYYKTGQIVLNLNNVKNREWDEYDNINDIKADLDLLFGGEE